MIKDESGALSVTTYRLRAKFVFDARFRLPPAVLGVLPSTTGVVIDGGGLDVRFGPWRLRTPLSNLRDARATGPFSAVKAVGPRLSLSDRGLTFGTSTAAGVCVRFREPVAGIEPLGLVKHPNLTMTVAEPELLVRLVEMISAA